MIRILVVVLLLGGGSYWAYKHFAVAPEAADAHEGSGPPGGGLPVEADAVQVGKPVGEIISVGSPRSDEAVQGSSGNGGRIRTATGEEGAAGDGRAGLVVIGGAVVSA